MSLFTRKPRARTSPQRDAKPVCVETMVSLREPADDGLDFDLTGFHAAKDYIRASLIEQGLMRGEGGK